MVQINSQIKYVKESATLAINNRVKYLRSIGEEVCHFGFGQASFDVPELVQKSLRDHAHEKNIFLALDYRSYVKLLLIIIK